MQWDVEVDERVEKDLDAAPPHVVAKFLAALDGLAEDPLRARPGLDIRPLAGRAGYRLRLGDWRVLFVLDRAARRVRVTTAGPRRSVYR